MLFSEHLATTQKGFGGKDGVEERKVDKAAMGYDYKGETEKHQSQKGHFNRCCCCNGPTSWSSIIIFASFGRRIIS